MDVPPALTGRAGPPHGAWADTRSTELILLSARAWVPVKRVPTREPGAIVDASGRVVCQHEEHDDPGREQGETEWCDKLLHDGNRLPLVTELRQGHFAAGTTARHGGRPEEDRRRAGGGLVSGQRR
ncbi:hypothetical protein GCM10025331_63230 [Actinoplanes utahensis]|nr:hypothetical protein Aut01nite_71770 [Actinoplanes utahensis]